MPGRLIVLEGIDGCGKTTQAGLLVAALRRRGLPAAGVREPGGTPVGERIREILLDPSEDGLSALGEVFLYMAARTELVRRVIAPALARGAIVVSDRFLWSSVAYQGICGGVGREAVERMGALALGGVRPRLTVVLDLDPDIAFARIGPRPDRIEGRGLPFQRRLREAFRELARTAPAREVAVVDAAGHPEAVHRRVLEAVDAVL